MPCNPAEFYGVQSQQLVRLNSDICSSNSSDDGGVAEVDESDISNAFEDASLIY